MGCYVDIQGCYVDIQGCYVDIQGCYGVLCRYTGVLYRYTGVLWGAWIKVLITEASTKLSLHYLVTLNFTHVIKLFYYVSFFDEPNEILDNEELYI